MLGQRRWTYETQQFVLLSIQVTMNQVLIAMNMKYLAFKYASTAESKEGKNLKHNKL